MDDIKNLDAVERYIRGEMTPDERLYFEQLRKTNHGSGSACGRAYFISSANESLRGMEKI